MNPERKQTPLRPGAEPTVPSPQLLSFDVFGTLVDWYEGLRRDLVRLGVPWRAELFDRIIDYQAQLERAEPSRSYRSVVAESLTAMAGLDHATAQQVADRLGHWPLFPDVAESLRSLLASGITVVAMTNSDRVHGQQVQEQLGYRLSAWFCAEDLRCYKPAEAFWHAVAQRLQQSSGLHWWHVSAYGDYDLATAERLGLTTVFVRRPHARPYPSRLEVASLQELLPRALRGRGSVPPER
jgi:2-haloacid dehalogenase